MKTIIKVLKSKGWKYDKVSKIWSHKQHDFEVSLDNVFGNEEKVKAYSRFIKLYKNCLYVTNLKMKNKFIPYKRYKKIMEKRRNFFF